MQRIGEFELTGELGRGGMGVVYRARKTSTGEEVALKVLLETSPQRRQRFLLEARVMQFLSRHPNIINLRDVGEEGGHLYLTMDLLRGRTLEQALGAGLPLKDAVDCLVKVARAVHFAHEAGVLHRDLKPGNVFLHETGQPVVMDLGLAKDLQGADDLTKTGTVVGTLPYMAPEQIRGQRGLLDRRVDVYALGAILYEALAGRRPFNGHATAIAAQILQFDPPPPRSIRPGAPAALEAVCLRALAKDPSKRYPNAEAFARALEEATHAGSTPAPPRTGGLLFASLAGNLLLLLACGALVSSGRGIPAAPETPLDSPAEAPDVPPVTGIVESLLSKADSASAIGEEREAARALLEVARIQREADDDDWLKSLEGAYSRHMSTIAEEGRDLSAPLLEAASEMLAGARGDPTQAPRIARARRLLLWFRYTQPQLPIPPQLLRRLVELSDSEHHTVRVAARPYVALSTVRLPELDQLLLQPLASTGPDSPADLHRWPTSWRPVMERHFDGHREGLKPALLEEVVLFRPGVLRGWYWLAQVSEPRAHESVVCGRVLQDRLGPGYGNWRLAEGLYQIGRSAEGVAFAHRDVAARAEQNANRNGRIWSAITLAKTQFVAQDYAGAIATLDADNFPDLSRSWFIKRRCYELLGDELQAEAVTRIIAEARGY